MAISDAARAADDVLRVSLARADRVVSGLDKGGRSALRELLADLEAADDDLRRRLTRFGRLDETFTAASLAQYQAQVALVRRMVADRLSKTTNAASAAAFAQGRDGTARLLADLEAAFTGAARPLRLRQAATMSEAARGSLASLLRQHATSVDRYGTAMIGEFEKVMRRGLISGATRREMVDALCGLRGPTGQVSLAARVDPQTGQVVRLRTEQIGEGLFQRYRSWAWRIVRTETAKAYNEARLVGLYEQRQTFPELRKKILAHFDDRTAPDSVVVHGQIRKLDEPFVDGAGRVYLRPPARPNDRETLIPWLPEWTETPISRPRSPSEQAAALASATPLSAVQKAALRVQIGGVQRQAGIAPKRATKAAPPPAPPTPPPPPPEPEPVAEASVYGTAQIRPSQGLEAFTLTAEQLRSLDERPAISREEFLREFVSAHGKAEKRGSPTPEDQQRLRANSRAYLRSLGLESRDAAGMLNDESRPRVDGDRHGSDKLEIRPPTSMRAYGLHYWHGAIEINRDRTDRALRAARAASAGASVSASDASGLRTYLHEEIHGCSPAAGSSYKALGRGLEEACVEILARDATRQATGVEPDGSYRDYVDHLTSIVGRHTGATDARARTTEAARRLFQSAATIDTPDAYAREFVRATLGDLQSDAALAMLYDLRRRHGNPLHK